MMNPKNNDLLFKKIINDKALRVELCKSSHLWFFSVYFSSYIKYELAQFHRDFFSLTEDQNLRLAVISAFRGSGKSTILTTSHALWAVFGFTRKKNVLIISQTQPQAKLHLKTIIDELKLNPLLRNDLQENCDECNATSITLRALGAKITCASLEQSMRGIRSREHRPDLIISDDIEDENSVKTKESRDKTFNLLTGEIIPAGDLDTSFWVIGNLLHEDSVISRLEERMKNKPGFHSMRIPITDDDDNPNWPGKFPTLDSIKEFKDSMPNPAMWSREYLLKIVRSEDKVIDPSWIKYYEKKPDRKNKDYRYTIISVDPAISQRETADFSAIVTGDVYGSGDNIKIYILPIIFNKRFSANEMIQKVKDIHKFHCRGGHTKVCIENVGFQGLLLNKFQNECNEYVEVVGVKTQGYDKRSRLMLASGSIERGEVLFPRQSSKDLIQQLVDFPIVKHDDLVDSLSMLINCVNENRGVSNNLEFGLITSRGLLRFSS